MSPTIDQVLFQAVEAHRAGKLKDAERLYREILEVQPLQADANHNLGVLAVGVGKPAGALPYLQRALKADSKQAQYWLSYINALLECGQLAEARKALQDGRQICLAGDAVDQLEMQLAERATRLQAGQGEMPASPIAGSPSEPEINHLLSIFNAGKYVPAETLAKELTEKYPQHAFGWKVLGAIFKLSGRPGASLQPMRQAALLAPNDAEVHSNLGVTLMELGHVTEAEASYRKAVSLSPGSFAAYSNLGFALHDLGRLDEAEASYREAIRLAPDFAETHYNLGNVLKGLARPIEAASSYRRAIALRPDYAEAHSNLGAALLDIGRPQEAETSFRDAIHLQPNLAAAHYNLGDALQATGRLAQAEKSYREAIRLKPNYVEAHSNLGVTQQDLGRLKEAEASYREALRMQPDHAEAHSNLLFSMNYAESMSPAFLLAEAKHYGAKITVKSVPKFTSWKIDAEQTKLRVGFVSGDLRNHPVGHFIEGLIQHLDRNAFELHAFPTTLETDSLSDRLKPGFKEWLPICGKSDHDAATLIHEQGIHVLIDLSGHTAHNRLPVFSYKPAPVQASWLGYFASTGLPEMDFFLGDPYMSPQSEQAHFTETLWNLQETWLCLTPPSQPILQKQVPASTNGYTTFGCFGNLAKMNDAVVETWAKVLQACPGAVLLLKSKQLVDAQIITQTQGRFASHGISADRLILEGPSSRAEYFAAHARIDIVLDTFPYPGGTTSVDALWMGVPVLTLKGDRFLSRLGASIAINAGQAKWIAQDRDDYVEKAMAFSRDLQGLTELRQSLRDRIAHTPLFDTKRFAKNFGDALHGMWRQK